MGGRDLTITPLVLGIIGLALLVFEGVQAMRRVVLGAVGTTVLFLGLGLVVIAAVLIVVAMSTDSATEAAAPESGMAENPADESAG
jgi:hypothetical protein